MKTVKTFTATIYIGFNEPDTDIVHTLNQARAICQKYVNRVSLCVSVTPTEFIYTNGSEPGCAIGLINYPRFPEPNDTRGSKAIELAVDLMIAFRQSGVTIVMPDETVLIEAA